MASSIVFMNGLVGAWWSRRLAAGCGTASQVRGALAALQGRGPQTSGSAAKLSPAAIAYNENKPLLAARSSLRWRHANLRSGSPVMFAPLQGVLALLGRILLSLLFIASVAMQKIPQFGQTAQSMAEQGVPWPEAALVGAIAFLSVGSLCLIFGCYARIGALLLLVFLVLATWYYHDFWKLPEGDPQLRIEQGNFMRNLALMGAMLLVVANGPGPLSCDAARARRKALR
jgi:putative oxidoreductase